MSSAFNIVLLLGFVVGIFSGLGVSLPINVKALLSGEKVMYRISSEDGISFPGTISIGSDYAAYGVNTTYSDAQINIVNLSTNQEVVVSDPNYSSYSRFSVFGDKVAALATSNTNVRSIILIDSVSGAVNYVTTAGSPLMTYKPRFDGRYIVWKSTDASELSIYDTQVDSDGDGIYNWQETIKPEPDPALSKISPNEVSFSSNFVLDGGKIFYLDGLTATIYDINSASFYKVFSVANSDIASLFIDSNNLVVVPKNPSGVESNIYVYDLLVDTDSNGIMNYQEVVKPNPDPALSMVISNDVFFGGDVSLSGNKIFTPIMTSVDSYVYNAVAIDVATGQDTLIAKNLGSMSMGSFSSYGNKTIFSKDRETDYSVTDIYYSIYESDTTEPNYLSLPNTTTTINYSEGQALNVTQLDIKVRPQDTGSGISKVEYLVDDSYFATDYTVDGDGIYEAIFDLKFNKPGGVTIKAIAYDRANNTRSLSVNVVPNPMIFPYTDSKPLTSHSGGEYDSRYVAMGNDSISYINEYPDGSRTLNLSILSTGIKTEVDSADQATGLGYPKIRGNYLVYSIGNQIKVYNIKTRASYLIEPSQGFDQLSYDIHDGYVYWAYQNWGQGGAIYKSEITEFPGEELVYDLGASTEGTEVYVNQGNLLFITQDTNTGVKSIYGLNLSSQDLYFSSGEVFPDLTVKSTDFYYPNLAIFGINGNGIGELILYNVVTQGSTVAKSYSINTWTRKISLGDKYLAIEERDTSTNCNSDRIEVYDIQKERSYYLTGTKTLTGSCYDSDRPSVYGDFVAWNSDYPDSLNSDENIYYSEIRYPDTINPTITSVAGLFGNTGGSANVRVYATDNVLVTSARISIDSSSFIKMSGNASPFTYSVPIPSDWARSTYPIKIRVYDGTGNYIEKSYVIAVNDSEAPVISNVEIPSGTTGETATIKITANDNVYLDKVEVNINSSGYQSATLKDGVYEFAYKVPLNSAADVNFSVKATDLTERFDEKTGLVMKVTDNDPPVITSVTTSEIGRRDGGTIVATATDNIAPVRGLITFDGVLWQNMTGTASPFTFQVSERQIKDDKLTYYVRVYDAAGNYDTTEPNTEPVVNNTVTEEPQSAVAKALTLVQGVIENVVKNTPEPVAKSFPYILFAALLASAYVFTVQARREAEQASKKLEMVRFRKVIADEKSNFVILVSHYLRTPLTLISSGIDEMLKDQRGEKVEKIRKANTHLGSVIQQIVSDIEKDTAISKIKNPNLRTEGIRAYTSPFIIIPALAIAGLVVYANYLFRNVADINLGTANLITQGVVFIVAIQVFAYYLRKKQNQHNNLKYFNQTIEYQVAVDEARTELLVNAKQKVNAAVADLRHDLGKKSNEYITEGLSRMDVILTKMGYLATLKYEDIQKSKDSASLQDMAEKILAKKKTEITEKKLKVRISLGALKTHDSQKIVSEIISEIIDNAIKFSPKSGVVVIKGDTKDGLNRITVSDQGRGISKREQLYIFKPFSRTSSALNFEHEGIGLGLYYARSLSNMLGGDIYIKSASDKGTEVTVVL